VTVPPVIDTLTTSAVPWTISPLLGESRVIFTGVGVDGRVRPPVLGMASGRVPDTPSAVADAQAARKTTSEVRRTRKDVA